jgi:anti-sigma B factor antagonist
MPLSLQSRRIGEITVVTCSGRIVEGPESEALQQHLSDLLPYHRYIILDLGQVDFVDSSGLGLLVRFLARTHTAQGGLKLCAVPPKVAEVLRLTRLGTIFDRHDSVEQAIAAFYQGATSAGTSDRLNTDILCVEHSADVLAFVRELLKQAGYGVMTATNLPDALILLKATRPKVLVIGADLRSARDTSAAATFNHLADARTVVELPPDFSSRDAGQAGQHVLDQVRAAVPS